MPQLSPAAWRADGAVTACLACLAVYVISYFRLSTRALILSEIDNMQVRARVLMPSSLVGRERTWHMSSTWCLKSGPWELLAVTVHMQLRRTS